MYLLSVGVLLASVAASGITVVTSVVGVGLWRDLASKCVQVTETVQHAVVYFSHHSDSYSAPPGFGSSTCLRSQNRSTKITNNHWQPEIATRSYTLTSAPVSCK